MKGYITQFPRPGEPEADGFIVPMSEDELRARFTAERHEGPGGKVVEWVYLDGKLFTKRTIAPHDATPAARREQNRGPR